MWARPTLGPEGSVTGLPGSQAQHLQEGPTFHLRAPCDVKDSAGLLVAAGMEAAGGFGVSGEKAPILGERSKAGHFCSSLSITQTTGETGRM